LGKKGGLFPSRVRQCRSGSVLKVYVRRVPITAPYFDAKRSDPVEAFVAEAHRHPVFRLVAETESGPAGEAGAWNG